MRMAGNESCMSTMRMTSVSTHPPKYAATSPKTRPIARANTVLAIPTPREMRRP